MGQRPGERSCRPGLLSRRGLRWPIRPPSPCGRVPDAGLTRAPRRRSAINRSAPTTRSGHIPPRKQLRRFLCRLGSRKETAAGFDSTPLCYMAGGLPRRYRRRYRPAWTQSSLRCCRTWANDSAACTWYPKPKPEPEPWGTAEPRLWPGSPRAPTPEPTRVPSRKPASVDSPASPGPIPQSRRHSDRSTTDRRPTTCSR